MNVRSRFLATAAVGLSIPLIYKVAPGTAIVMTIALLALAYVAWKHVNR
jgi:hypothetical protein